MMDDNDWIAEVLRVHTSSPSGCPRRKAIAVDPGVAAVDRIGKTAESLLVVVEAVGVVIAGNHLLAHGAGCVQHSYLRFTLHGSLARRRRRVETRIVHERIAAAPIIV